MPAPVRTSERNWRRKAGWSLRKRTTRDRGVCANHERALASVIDALFPIALVDVAGLVPGASEGRGRGNAFLADLANCDVLIQVVDAAGSTDLEGQFTGATSSSEDAIAAVQAEIEFLEQELDAWIGGLLEDGWNRGVRRVQAEGEKGLTSFVQERLSGLGATPPLVAQGMSAFNELHTSDAQPWDWDSASLHLLGRCMREQLFPIVYAANKMDIAPQGVVEAFSDRSIYACMADMELALRRASRRGSSIIAADSPALRSRLKPPSTRPRKKPSITCRSAYKPLVEQVLPT